MSRPEAHIAAWEAAGIIDEQTAAHLRAAPVEPADAAETATASASATAALVVPTRGVAASVFGPGVTIGEMFGYLGVGFLLAGWLTFVGRSSQDSAGSSVSFGVGVAAAGAALAGLAAWLRSGSDRLRRAAGVGFFVATGLIGSAVAILVPASADPSDHLPSIAGTLAAVGAAVAFRRYLPAVVTHLGLLVAATTLASSLLAWLQDVLVPPQAYYTLNTGTGLPPRVGIDPLVLVVGEAAWWVLVAVGFGLVGLREARSRAPDAGRRAAASRAWAGATLVIGLAVAVSRSDVLAGGSYGRVLEAWVGDLAILVACAVLVERAFRREASAYVYPAALGLIIAATDLNVSYLSDSVQVGLLIEGAILLAAGVAADRLRRQVGRPSIEPSAAVV